MLFACFGVLFTAPPILRPGSAGGAREAGAAGAALPVLPRARRAAPRVPAAAKMSRAAQKSLNAKAGPTWGRGNQPRPAATAAATECSSQAPRAVVSVAVAATRVLTRRALTSPVGEILSSPKDPSAMQAPGRSAATRYQAKAAGELRWLFFVRGSLAAKKRPREHANGGLRRSSRLAKHQSSQPALSTEPLWSSKSWANLCKRIQSPCCHSTRCRRARCGEIMRDSVLLQPSGSSWSAATGRTRRPRRWPASRCRRTSAAG